MSRTTLHTRGWLAMVLLACALASGLLLAARWIVGGQIAYAFLAWNLFLAGLPFAFALLATLTHDVARPGAPRSLAVAALLALWLLFFPNAPYLLTDLAHLHLRLPGAPRWYDAALFAAFVGTGVISGLASLLLVHGLVARARGRAAGWAAIVAASLLGGFGISLGRFARLNSWDLLARPGRLVATLLDPLRHPGSHQRTMVATVLYSGFILLGYLAIMAMLREGRHLLPEEPAREPSGPPPPA